LRIGHAAPWSEILLDAQLNPVYLDLEPVALANYLYASLPHEERRQSQAIPHISVGQAEIIAFQHNRFQRIKLEISAFDQVLLADIEDVDSPEGGFWDEVGGRVGNALKQGILFLQEEQDFSPFSVIHLAVDAPRAGQLMRLLNEHFTLAPVTLWNTLLGAEPAPSVTALLAGLQNNSGYASLFGLGMRKLGTFGDSDPGIIKLSLLPAADNLRRNRQLGVISRTLFKFSTAIAIFMGVWTLGLVVPAFTDSERKSRDIDQFRQDANAARSRLADFQKRVQTLQADLNNLDIAARPRSKTLILEMLPDLVPYAAELFSYRIEDGMSVQITGSAETEAQIFRFANDLATRNLLEDPQATPNERSYDDLLDFTLTGKLRQMR
jgi:type II secretory pathway pseudopilin PulG